MSKTIADLRDRLFDTLDALSDKDTPMEIERARAISDIAQTIINSAKVEVDHMRLSGGAGTGFVPEQSAAPAALEPPLRLGLVDQAKAAGAVRTHKLRG